MIDGGKIFSHLCRGGPWVSPPFSPPPWSAGNVTFAYLQHAGFQPTAPAKTASPPVEMGRWLATIQCFITSLTEQQESHICILNFQLMRIPDNPLRSPGFLTADRRHHENSKGVTPASLPPRIYIPLSGLFVTISYLFNSKIVLSVLFFNLNRCVTQGHLTSLEERSRAHAGFKPHPHPSCTV